MALVRGPFDVEWGDVVLAGVEEISVDYNVETNDVTTVQGNTYTITGAHKASASLTFLETDVAVLRYILPQYWKPNGAQLSSGEVVSDTNGAIDVLPGGCTTSTQKYGLIITSCGNPGQVFRILATRTDIEDVTFEDGLRRVVVTFIGEPDASLATIQFFKEGALGNVS